MQSFYVKQLQRSTSVSSACTLTNVGQPGQQLLCARHDCLQLWQCSGGSPAPSAEYPSHERIEKVVALPRISHGRGVSKQPIVVVTADFRSGRLASRQRPPAAPNPPQTLCTYK